MSQYAGFIEIRADNQKQFIACTSFKMFECNFNVYISQKYFWKSDYAYPLTVFSTNIKTETFLGAYTDDNLAL